MQKGWLISGIIILFLGVMFFYQLPAAANIATCPTGSKCIFNETGPILIQSQTSSIYLLATSTSGNIYLNYLGVDSYGLGIRANGDLYHNSNSIVVADGRFYAISISGLSGGFLGQMGHYTPANLLGLTNSQQIFTFSTSTAYWGVDAAHSASGLGNTYSWLTTNLVGQLAFVRDSDGASSRQYLQYRFNDVNSPNNWDGWIEFCDSSNNCHNFLNPLDNVSNNSLVMYQDPDMLMDSGLKVNDPSSLSNCSSLSTNGGVISCGSGGGDISGSGTTNYLPRWSNASTLADSILYQNSTGIGLGTASPFTKLHIYDATSGPIITLSGLDTNYRGLVIKDTSDAEKWFFGSNTSTNTNFVIRATSSNDILTISSSNGNVGIGTASPEEQLTITKNFRLSPTTHENLNGIIYKDSDRFIHDFNYGYSGSTTTVGQNTFIGINAGNLTMGEGVTSRFQASYNVGVGASAFTSNTSGNYNTAVGASSLYSNTAGTNNTALGYTALASNTSGNYNTAVGASSLNNNATGTNNTALGYSSLYSNTAGTNNTALGYSSLYSNTTGFSNTALGSYALRSNTTGASNTALGYYALYNNQTGGSNVAVGINAGMFDASNSALTQSTNSIFLGGSTKAQSNGQTNQIVIGGSAVGAGSNSVVLGNSSITKTLLRGDIGIGTSSPATNFHIYDATSGPIITLSGLDSNYRGLVIKDTSDAEKWFFGSNTSTNTNFVIRATSSNDILTISSSNGNVGIGAMPDDSVKLNVAGTIKTNLTTTTEISRCLYVDKEGVISAQTSDCGTDGSSISGSGTDNYLTKWSNVNTLGTSIIYDSGTNVGIGTTSSEGTLMVSGTGYFTGEVKVATPVTTSDAVNLSYLNETMKFVHDVTFAGPTASSYNGNNGGYDTANAICDAAYDGSHICTTEDILRIINSGNVNSIPTTTIGYWIVNGPPAYEANANDCIGFTTSSSAMLGNVWIRPPEYPNSFGILRHCNQSHQFACCKYIYD